MSGVGELASIIAVAQLGVKTATALGNYIAAVRTSSETVRKICRDINAIAGSLYQLDQLKTSTQLDKGKRVPLLTPALIKNITVCSKTCKACF